jgi:hypothetical protein
MGISTSKLRVDTASNGGHLDAVVWFLAFVTLLRVKNGVFWDVALVRTDVSEELSASFIGVTRIGELGTSNQRTLRRNTK